LAFRRERGKEENHCKEKKGRTGRPVQMCREDARNTHRTSKRKKRRNILSVPGRDVKGSKRGSADGGKS